jgi:hypothetical protein
MFVATLNLANDDADFLGVAWKFVQVLDIGDRGGFESGRLEVPRVVCVNMAGMDAEGAGFGRGGGHLNLRQQQRTPIRRIH